jgi:hypothetical protein
MDDQKANINIDPDKIEAKYCDQTLITHNAFGFTMDFAQQIPQMKMIKILSRVAMSPEHAKAFLEALAGNVKMYEDKFGEIELSKKMRDQALNPSKIGFQIQKETPK